jgi:hypothetical protein
MLISATCQIAGFLTQTNVAIILTAIGITDKKLIFAGHAEKDIFNCICPNFFCELPQQA